MTLMREVRLNHAVTLQAVGPKQLASTILLKLLKSYLGVSPYHITFDPPLREI